MRDELLGLVCGLAIQIHFMLVLYTHFKNADLVKSSGGCMPDSGRNNVQMSDVQATDTSVDSSGSGDGSNNNQVNHAVDDENLRHS